MGLQNPVHRFDSGRRLSKKVPQPGLSSWLLVVRAGAKQGCAPGLEPWHGSAAKLQAVADRDHAALPVFKL
jgi:hypothetical protein